MRSLAAVVLVPLILAFVSCDRTESERAGKDATVGDVVFNAASAECGTGSLSTGEGDDLPGPYCAVNVTVRNTSDEELNLDLDDQMLEWLPASQSLLL